MILFLDSNVTIGYVFRGDSWNHQSKYVINCPNDKYYSNNVLNETKKKIKIISKLVYREILEISNKLLKNTRIPDFITINDLNSFERYKCFPYVIMLFEENYAFDISKEQFSLDLKVLANVFMQEYVYNFQDLKSKIKLHHRSRLHISLQNTLLENVHDEDVLIILDAHDLCLESSPLTFITADSNEEKDQFILNETNIENIRDLRSFSIGAL